MGAAVRRAVRDGAAGFRLPPHAGWGIAFVLPAFLLLLIFRVYPILSAVAVSFTDYDLFSTPSFTGLSNYSQLATDPQFRQSLLASITYVVGVSIPTWGIALALALAFDERVPFRNLLRTGAFMPVVMTAVPVAVVWKFLFHPFGLVNVFLSRFGVDRINWLTDQSTAMPALIIVGIWRAVPYFMVIFLAGLQAIPRDYYEAASLDGASAVSKFRHITLPLLRRTSVLVIIMTVIVTMKAIMNPLIMTGGGPAGMTRVLPLLIYQTGFQYYRMGLASAMSVVMLLLVLLFTVWQLRLFREKT
jgi:ABC-type sugar transport system permease subunit